MRELWIAIAGNLVEKFRLPFVPVPGERPLPFDLFHCPAGNAVRLLLQDAPAYPALGKLIIVLTKHPE